VEREVRPALENGALVVMERYVDSPLAHFSAVGSVQPAEVEGLVDWATGRLRPDVTILLDRSPVTMPADVLDEAVFGRTKPGTRAIDNIEHHWRVQRLLTEMASADPDRYVVVDADGTEDEIAERVSAAVLPLFAERRVPKPVVETT
jgi:dTMP kinase